MNLSELQLPPPKILLYGRAGSWKTSFSTTLGQHTEVLDVDQMLRVCTTVQDKFRENRLQIDVRPCYDDNPNTPTAWNKLRRRVVEIANLIVAKKYDRRILVLDSLTSAGDHAMRSVRAAKGKLNSGEPATIPEWGLAINEVEQVLALLKQLPICVIINAHELVEEVDGSTQVKIWTLGSKLPNKLPSYFNEIWYARSIQVAGGATKHVLQTKLTSITARSTNLPDQTDMELGLEHCLKQIGWQP